MPELTDVPSIALGLVRPIFVLAALPLMGNKPLPFALQAILALGLAVFTLPQNHLGASQADVVTLLPIACIEAVTGFAIGMALSTALAGARLGGEVVGSAIGIGFAALVDPEHGEPVPLIGEFFSLCATALFIAIDGPTVVARLLMTSYRTVPLGTVSIVQTFGGLTTAASWMFAAGLTLALPVIVATLMAQFGFAVIGRLAPQLNLFAVGLPATLIVGLVALTLTFSTIGHQLVANWRVAETNAVRVAVRP